MSGERVPHSIYWLLALLTLAWGFNWTVAKTVLTEMQPLHFRTWCLSFGVIGLFSIARAGGQRIRVPERSWGRLIAMGTFNILLWNLTATPGIQLLASGRAVILAYTYPIWGIIFSIWLLGEPLTRQRLLGLVLGMAGMGLLLGGEFAAIGRSPLGALLLIASAVSWALGVVCMKRWPVDLPTTSLTAWQMLISLGPMYLAALLFEEGSFSLFALSTLVQWGLAYSVLVAFIFCYWAWMKIATVAPVTFSTIGMLMVPVVGVFSGVLVLGEPLVWGDYLALVLVVAAVAVILRPAPSARVFRAD